MSDLTELSEREREILSLVASGASNKEIASKLYISANTVKVHLRNIFSKIGANSRTEAAMLAIRTGMVEVPGNRRGNNNEIGAPALGMGAEAPAESIQDRGRNLFLWGGFGFVGLVILIVIGFLLVPEITRGQNNPAAGSAPTILEPSWKTNAPMPTARWGMALASIGNQVYLIAGSADSGITGILERYDSATNDWEELLSKPEPVTDVHAAVIGGRIYVPGGRTGTGEITSVLEIYDPIADRWDKGQPLPDALSGYAMVTYEGKFLLFGGWDGDGFVDSVYEYIPDQDAWFNATPMPTARGFAGAAVAGGRIYVFGGFDGQNALDVNEVYLPANEGNGEPAWQTADPLPSPRYNMGVASLADIIHVVGGTGEEDTPLPSLQFPALTGEWEIYDSPLIGSWTQMGMGTAGTHIYLIGGELNGSPSTNNLSYQAIYLINLPVIR